VRPFARLAGCVVVAWILLPTANARAQAPSAFTVAPDLTAPRVDLDRAASLAEEPPSALWAVDLLLGVPTGVRISVGPAAPNTFVPALEGFAGFYVILPMAGAGLRWSLSPVAGERDALLVRPGIDAYALDNPFDSGGWFGGGPRGIGVIAGDVEFIWQHHFDRRWSGELGLKLGAGTVFSSRVSGVAPIGAIFLGFHF
jgi:hypothetical protein